MGRSKQVYVNRDVETNQVEIIRLKRGSKERVYQGPGQPEDFPLILESVKYWFFSKIEE